MHQKNVYETKLFKGRKHGDNRLIYGIAIAIGILTFDKASSSVPEIWALLLADVAATVFVWIMGLVYKNVSVYDPYWSVAPPVMFTAWAIFKG